MIIPRLVAQWFCALLLLAMVRLVHADAIIEHVRFPSLDLEASTGQPLMLNGLLFRPAGDAGKRVPAVVALHGCGGMYSVAKSRRDELSIRHRAMADLLVAEGYAVLFPDSFRSRGRETICKEPNAGRTLTQAHRRLDTLGALVYLQGRADITRNRIAVLGWSHGGSTVLATMNEKARVVRIFRDGDPSASYFRSAIAFYPGCFDSVRAKEGYAPAAPLLLLVGGSDDWTSPRPCVALVDRLRRDRETASIVVYPDTYHGFDGPSSQPRLRLDVPNGVHPGQGVTVAVNPPARENAYARVKAHFREALTGDKQP